MDVRDPREVVEELVELVGKREAIRALIQKEVAPSTAEKLVRGTYTSDVGFLTLKKIYAALDAAKKVPA